MTCLSEESLEEGSRQHVPGNGISDGGEDPVQLSQRGLAVSLLARNAVNKLLGQSLLLHQAAGTEPTKSDLHTHSADDRLELCQNWILMLSLSNPYSWMPATVVSDTGAGIGSQLLFIGQVRCTS